MWFASFYYYVAHSTFLIIYGGVFNSQLVASLTQGGLLTVVEVVTIEQHWEPTENCIPGQKLLSNTIPCPSSINRTHTFIIISPSSFSLALNLWHGSSPAWVCLIFLTQLCCTRVFYFADDMKKTTNIHLTVRLVNLCC